ncbi:glycosyltransferase [Leptothrix ochracea L12]|uniref:Glycosyltransferase n=1 Tax=Leptothrix ochracea L12 TaxID=735332 RepID=I4Z525_9BURK|nr:glycosyltransferase family 4 protein [Leptothrix ochracea]EIM31317.1 glycosyltransferase [Leptothrix ochracea L12]
MKIAIVANTAWYVANFRLNLMRALRHAGHEVVAIAPPDAAHAHDSARITAAGFKHCVWPLSGRGKNPVAELGAVLGLRRWLHEEGVDLVLSYTPKGNIYSALARSCLPCRQIANVSGLGSSFIASNLLTKLVQALYRLTFARIDWVFFQNEDDRQIFLQAGLVSEAKSERIPGSGVDLQHFQPTPLPSAMPLASSSPEPRTFLLIARLLGDKGVREFVEAARMVREDLPQMRFQLLGLAAADNPTAIRAEELSAWLVEGVVSYLGHHSDVRPFIAEAHCVVLPSYREGVPRTLLEAGAMGRPLIATDVPGCRDTITPGRNGWLCTARDPGALADAMTRMALLPRAALEAMGAQSALKMQREFSEEQVIARYLERVGRV